MKPVYVFDPHTYEKFLPSLLDSRIHRIQGYCRFSRSGKTAWVKNLVITLETRRTRHIVYVYRVWEPANDAIGGEILTYYGEWWCEGEPVAVFDLSDPENSWLIERVSGVLEVLLSCGSIDSGKFDISLYEEPRNIILD